MFQRILLPLDGSKTAEKVLLFGQKEGKLHGATIILLRAIAPLRQSLIQVPSVVDNVYQQIENIALDYLENVAEFCDQPGLRECIQLQHPNHGDAGQKKDGVDDVWNDPCHPMLQLVRSGQHPVAAQQEARNCRRTSEDMNGLEYEIGHGRALCHR